ncbi:MAG: hypothetical protein WCG21_04555 [Eubacteriales bacterium]
MAGKYKAPILIPLFFTGIMMLTSCKMPGSITLDAKDGTIITAASFVVQTTKEPTETAVVTTPAQKADVTPAMTVQATAAATTMALETAVPTVETKASAAPAATTKSTTTPAATTKNPASTSVATTQVTTAATTAASVTDYTAVCAEIRSKLIVILEANGQWDAAFTGENNSDGSQWWDVGFYDDREMSLDDFAQHFFANKFDRMAICGTSITCYMEDDKINIVYKGYWTS